MTGENQHFPQAAAHVRSRFRPDSRPILQPAIEQSTLADLTTDGAGLKVEHARGVLDLGLDLLGECCHAGQTSVIFHTLQRESSYSQALSRCGKFLSMNESEVFRENLLRIIAERGLPEAQVSTDAGLNRRAVTDIRERRTASPKLSTVMALAKALSVDPGELLGLGRRHRLNARLAAFLEQYSEDDQERFLDALAALPRSPR